MVLSFDFLFNDVKDRRLKMMTNESENVLNELKDPTLKSSNMRRQISEIYFLVDYGMMKYTF